MLAVAIKLPNHPRPRDIQKVVDILPADFYPNSSPMDCAIHAADHAADRASLARRLIEQYNFKMKVVGEHDTKVAQMAQLLSDAQKEADFRHSTPLRAAEQPCATFRQKPPSTPQ